MIKKQIIFFLAAVAIITIGIKLTFFSGTQTSRHASPSPTSFPSLATKNIIPSINTAQ